MIRAMLVVILTLSALVAMSCSLSKEPSAPAEISSERAIPPDATAQELLSPEEGKAKVYFFSFGGDVAGRGNTRLFIDKEYIGSMGSTYYYGVDVEPGEHVIWATYAIKKWFLRANLAAGKTYYIKLQSQGAKRRVRRYNPIPSPVLLNACPNNNSKEGKKLYADLEKWLSANKFILADYNTPEIIANTNEELADEIAEIWTKWESEWSADARWDVIDEEDGY
jgi:hypothetical protein